MRTPNLKDSSQEHLQMQFLCNFRAKFGAEFAGSGGTDLASIAQQEMSKFRVKTKFAEAMKIKKRNRKRGRKSLVKQEAEITDLRLDHRKYGAWYLKPTLWEKRFHQISDSQKVAKIKARRKPASDFKNEPVAQATVRSQYFFGHNF